MPACHPDYSAFDPCCRHCGFKRSYHRAEIVAHPSECTLEQYEAAAPPGCKECAANQGKLAPSHNGSRLCRSGSIASGGQRAHCACNACF
jgi:hypothetical protein